MGLADTIRETFGGAHTEHSSEASRGLVDHHTPGAFPADTPVAEEQRELGSQSNTTTTAGSNVLAGKEGGVRGHEHKDSGVGLSDVTGSHPKTVGRDDLLHSSTGSNKLSDVTHSHPQTVEKGALHGSSAASDTPTASGLSDVTHSRPETVGRDTVHNTAAGNTAPDSDVSDVTHSHPQTVEKGALQSHPQSTLNKDATTGGSHFRRSSVSMPTDSTGTGPSETLASHKKNDTSTLGSLLGGNYYGGAKTDRSTYEKEHANEPASRGLLRSEDHNRAHQGTEGSTIGSGASSGTTLGAHGTDSSAQHNTVSNGRDKSSTDHPETYWGDLPSAQGAQGVYNTVTGSGSGEDHTSVHRHVPAAGDSEVAMQSAGHGPEARAPRGAGVYNTVVGHGSAADDTHPSGENRSAEHQRTPSGGLYNTITTAAQGLYNTVSGRSGSGTEHQYEHDKPLTTTTSTSTGTGNTGLTGNNSRIERDSPSGTTSATSPRSGTTTSDTTGNQGIAAGAYNAAASAAQGISSTVTGNNNNNTNATGSQYEQNRPTTSTGPTGTRNTTTSSTEPGMAAGAYNAVANTAQSVADTVTGRNTAANQYEQGGPYDDSTTSRSVHPSGSSTDNTSGTHRAFPLDNSSTFTTTNRSIGSDHNPAATSTTGASSHSHTGRNLAGAGAGAAAGAGVYDFLHRKEGDAPDPKNEFVSNVNPYNAPTHEHEGWQPSDSAGLFSDSELKRLSLRQKEMGDEELSPRSPAANLYTSGPGQTSSGSGVAYDTPQSLTAASSTGQRTRGDDYTDSSQTHGLGSGHPAAHKSEIPIPSRAHENLTPTSLDSQRADPPRSSDRSGHSNVEKGLAGAGLGAGAGYGASRLARDHHDDNKHGAGATSSIPAPTTTSRHHEPVESSTLNRSAEPVSSSSHHHHHKDNKDATPATTGSMLPLPSKHHDRHAEDTTTASGVSGQNDEKDSHKVRNVAAFGAAAGAGAAGYDMLSHGDSSPTGVRQPGQSAANTGSTSHPTMSSVATDRRTSHTPAASSSLNTATSPTTTTTTSTLDDPQRSRAGMTSLNPTAGVAGFGVGAGGAGAAVASGMHQDGRPHQSHQHQQREQEALSRSGDDGHAPLHSTADKHFKERGTAVPSANAGKRDPYNHLASGTPSGVSMD